MNKNRNLFVLIALGIMWSSFSVFTKVSAEVFSPYFVAFARLFLGGTLLYLVALFSKKKVFVAKNFKHYAIVGFFNSAMPFTLFAVAAKQLDSGIVAILDGTVPMFEVLISILILKKHVGKNAIFGVCFGVVGIVITSYGSVGSFNLSLTQILAILAILAATFSYAGATLYVSAKSGNIDSMILATGSVIFSAILLSPSVFFVDLSLLGDVKVLSSLLGLGLLCTGIAYIFYFKLLAEEGARTAVSVVLLIPVFGTIFGMMVLGESITISKIVGCIAILASLKFILNLSSENFFKTKNSLAKNAPVI